MKIINKKSIPVILLLSIAAASFLVCGRNILPQAIEDVSDAIYYHELSKEITSEMEQDMRRDTKKMPTAEELDEGIAAWLKIEGTKINYPVMQEKHGEEGAYLCHRPDGKYSKGGSLYIPSYDSVECGQIIIYGHHMHNGRMFAGLAGYKDEKWAQKHMTVRLTTADGEAQYKVFAVMVQSIRNRDFRWEDSISFDGMDDKANFEAKCRDRSVVDLQDENDVPSEDTSYLTMVTCDYSVPDGRLIVVCRKE